MPWYSGYAQSNTGKVKVMIVGGSLNNSSDLNWQTTANMWCFLGNSNQGSPCSGKGTAPADVFYNAMNNNQDDETNPGDAYGSYWGYLVFPDRHVRGISWADHDNTAKLQAMCDSVLAAYTQKTKFALTVSATNGTVTKSPDAATYDSATVVKLTAVPAAGYVFDSWTGATGTADTTSVKMTSAKTVTANFKLANGILMPSGTGNTVTVNGDTVFYDDGGPGANYSELFNGVLTMIAADPANGITVTFDSLNTEQGYDTLQIFDGATTSAPLIGTWSGTVKPPKIVSTSGSLTFHFASDQGGEFYGWSAQVQSSPLVAIAKTLATRTSERMSVCGSQLNLDGASVSGLRFYSLDGGLVKSVTGLGRTSVNLEKLGLPAGLYIARAIKNGSVCGSIRCILK